MGELWTVDERIDDQERTGQIAPPFSPDERALARANLLRKRRFCSHAYCAAVWCSR
jgi:hypothetical protein